jgi:hypothetical protein
MSIAFELARSSGGGGASPGAAAPARAGDVRLDMRNAVASSGAFARRDVRPTCCTTRSRRDLQRQGRRSFPESDYRKREMRLMTPPASRRAS